MSDERITARAPDGADCLALSATDAAAVGRDHANDIRLVSVHMLDGRFGLNPRSNEDDIEWPPEGSLRVDCTQQHSFSRDFWFCLTALSTFRPARVRNPATDEEETRLVVIRGAFESIHRIVAGVPESKRVPLLKVRALLDVWPYWREFVGASIQRLPVGITRIGVWPLDEAHAAHLAGFRSSLTEAPPNSA